MASFNPTYDVIVVGGGHAGSEAAAAAARLGSKTLLITMNLDVIAKMSCNPAMGGVAKGQLIKEIDALGGLCGIVSDETGVQFKMLNRSKGPAMWSPRAQSDRMLYSMKMREKLEQIENLHFRQESVNDIIIEDKIVKGVVTQTGQKFYSKTVILTSGTFMNGIIHIGEANYGGGRSGERASVGISAALENNGFEVSRLKTGTPPRIDGRTVDYSQLEEQKGDEIPTPFSFLTDTLPSQEEQLSCWIGYTDNEVHETLKTGFDRSPMFSGRIKSIGPRYCPSIEDKINRFVDKERHQLFLEPEGWNTHEMYLNGFSTSLPEEVQYEALRKIKGFENAVMIRPGYAIEYDYFPPHQIKRTLETKLVDNLYFAGQINGTTGYEEAACQGLMAGINAHQKINNKEALVLKRSEAYIGVLIDDLINKGTEEPYRMFTSRAEHRIILRQDNADKRLTEIGYKIGLASKERYDKMVKKYDEVDRLYELLLSRTVRPEKMNRMLDDNGTTKLNQPVKAYSVLTRPQVTLGDMLSADDELSDEIYAITTDKYAIEQAEIMVKYSSYIDKEYEMVEELKAKENKHIPDAIDYTKIQSLSTEGRIKLDKIRPETIGQAGRISGVSASDVSVLMVYLK